LEGEGVGEGGGGRVAEGVGAAEVDGVGGCNVCREIEFAVDFAEEVDTEVAVGFELFTVDLTDPHELVGFLMTNELEAAIGSDRDLGFLKGVIEGRLGGDVEAVIGGGGCGYS
jgi:hypothetical protein